MSATQTDSIKVGRLNSLSALRLEYARVYREARAKKIPLEEAKVLVDLLSGISQLIQGKGSQDKTASNEAVVAA